VAGSIRKLKFVLTAGTVPLGATALEHRPVNTSLKSPDTAKPTRGSA
jgi:hypothetical protein